MRGTTGSCTGRSEGPGAPLARMLGLAVLLVLMAFGAGAAALAACTDGDGDGYGSPGDPNCPAGGQADCDDTDAGVNPGEAERCDAPGSPEIDDDCDGMTNEGYTLGVESGASTGYDCNDLVDNDGDGFTDVFDPDCQAAACSLFDPMGCAPGDPGGCCETVSFTQCTADNSLSTVCPVPLQGILEHDPEGPAGNASCTDTVDNDCDNLIDVGLGGDPDCCEVNESCDGVDNDCDGSVDEGFDVGDSCSAGTGACEASGAIVCDANGQGSHCTAVPFSPGTEGPFGSGTCADGVDNDCDGDTDTTDAASCCQASETCDGLDNDCDGFVDEDFTDLGDACSAGEGQCQAAGVRVCSPDQTATTCNAVQNVAGPEGPTGATCTDTIDNDCDGVADALDPGCGSANLNVICSLPLIRARPGDDCTVWRRLRWSVSGADPDTLQVTAELLGLDPEGSQISVLPVAFNDRAHIASRVQARNFKSDTIFDSLGPKHQVFAPVPVLRVTAKDAYNEATAYCSPIPWLHVFEPSGQVITEASGDVLHVEAAIPLVDPHTLFIKVDGVDIVAALGLDPATDFPGGPYGGPVMIGTEVVQVSNLVVSSTSVDLFASNTVRLDLTGMPCGGHVIVVDGDKRPGVFEKIPTPDCLVDDLRDKGNATSFQVSIDTPGDQSTGNPVPTPVEGDVCHGLPIAGLLLNGKPQDVSGQTVMPGDGEDSGDLVELHFMDSLAQTDLDNDLANGDEPQGTFDLGSNRAIADATDNGGHRAFDQVIFSTGTVGLPGTPLVNPEVIAQVEAHVREQLQLIAEATVPQAFLTSGVAIDNGFVIGIKEDAIADFFANKCGGAAEQFAQRAEAELLAKPNTSKSVGVPCSCDPTVTIDITAVDIDPADNTCPIDFVPNQINVRVNLPDVHVTTTITGSCKDTFLGACISKTVVNMTIQVDLTDIGFDFVITEAQLAGSPGPPPGAITIGGSTSTTISGGFSIHCIGADICNVVAEIFTFGAADLSPDLDFSSETDFVAEVGAGQPDPINLEEVKLDELEIQQKEQTATATLDEVIVEDGGLTARLTANIAASSVDPEVEGTPGAVITPQGPPSTPFGPAGDVYIGIADDVFNQLFASMAISGKLKTQCVEDMNNPITIGSLLGVCADIDVMLDTPEASEAATVAAQGLCYGLNQADCETLATPSYLLIPAIQGICHGIQGDNCSMVDAGLAGIVQPADCESIAITLDSFPALGDLTTALAQGICHGSKGDDCELLSGGTAILTGTEQGACWGATTPAVDCQLLAGATLTEKATCEAVKGVNACNSLPIGQPLLCTTALGLNNGIDALLGLVEREACEASPPLGFEADDRLLFCTRADIPPRLLIQDQVSDPVETAIRLNDLSVALVVDRDANGLDGELAATPGCFGAGAPTTGDCTFYGLCLDLNFVTEMQFQTCTDGEPGLVTSVQDVQATIRDAGVVCGAAMAGSESAIINSGANNRSIDEVMENVDQFTPPACADGFTLGDVVSFSMPRLIAIETDGNPEFQEYLAITGDISP